MGAMGVLIDEGVDVEKKGKVASSKMTCRDRIMRRESRSRHR